MSARWVIAGAFVVGGVLLVIYAMQNLVWPIAPITTKALEGGPNDGGISAPPEPVAKKPPVSEPAVRLGRRS